MKLKAFLLLLTLFINSLAFPAVKAFAAESSLRCSPSTGTYSVGDTFTVDYILDTRGYPAFGADINADYDSSILEVVGTQSTVITDVTNWTDPVTNTIDSSLGHIQLDYGSSQSSATVSASIGQITFKANAAGQAQFNYSFFQPSDNTTPGVAKVWGMEDASQELTNILTDVNNCIYVIEGASVATPTPSGIPQAPSVTSAVQNQPTSSPNLPRTGNVETGVMMFVTSGVFVILGLYARKLSK